MVIFVNTKLDTCKTSCTHSNIFAAGFRAFLAEVSSTSITLVTFRFFGSVSSTDIIPNSNCAVSVVLRSFSCNRIYFRS